MNALTGLRRAAILLAAIEPETARGLLRRLAPADRQRVLVEVALLEKNPPRPGETGAVLREFNESAVAGEPGRSVVDALVGSEPGSAPAMPFEFLSATSADQVAPAVRDEHPQAVAVILGSLSPAQAARVLDRLPLKMQVEVIRRLVDSEPMSPEVIARVEKTIQSKLSSRSAPVGGIRAAAAILNRVQPGTGECILETLGHQDADFATRLRGQMNSFEDLAGMSDRGIHELLAIVSRDKLAVALKAPAPEVAARIFKNLHAEEAGALQRVIDSLGSVAAADVAQARLSIMAAARRVEVE